MYMCIVNNLICKIRLFNKLIKKKFYWTKILYLKYSFTNVLQVKAKYISKYNNNSHTHRCLKNWSYLYAQ